MTDGSDSLAKNNKNQHHAVDNSKQTMQNRRLDEAVCSTKWWKDEKSCVGVGSVLAQDVGKCCQRTWSAHEYSQSQADPECVPTAGTMLNTYNHFISSTWPQVIKKDKFALRSVFRLIELWLIKKWLDFTGWKWSKKSRKIYTIIFTACCYMVQYDHRYE